MINKQKKAIFFSIDALFASIIIISAIVMLIDTSYIQKYEEKDMSYATIDLINSFSNIKINEINNTYVKDLIANGIINNTENTIIEQIGEFYVLNNSEYAKNLSKEISKDYIPDKFGFSIIVSDEEVYSNNISINKDLVTSKRLISGIEKFKPIFGSTSKVYLEGLSKKKDSAFIFFGGFIGQGNISKFTSQIPSDANITNIYLEMEVAENIGDKFNVFFNGVQCLGDLNKTISNMKADSYDLTSCKSSINPGDNNSILISFLPVDDLDIAYISGGFLQIDYETSEMFKEKSVGFEKYYFPTIEGIINLYSSIYVPGNITKMNICLKYFVNHTGTNSTFYLKIGNNTILKDNSSTSVENICFNNDTLVNDKGLDYNFLSGKNIPIRVGAENVSYYTEYLGNADSILVTDVSGSMGWRMDMDSVSGSVRNCEDPNFNNSDTERLSIAKCLDKDFIYDMLNITGNKVGLVSYESSTDSTLSLREENISLINEVDSYNDGGGTCICCGINSAKNLLSGSINRIVLISSGSVWKYNDFDLQSEPVLDSNNNSWYEFNYDNQSYWSEGITILGSTNSYSYAPYVDTEIASSLAGNALYVNLWENMGDDPGAPNDFSSETLNHTGNDFGILGNDDGWDYQSGTYDYTGNVRFDQINNQRLEIYTYDNDEKVSGAYGILFNISQEMYDVLNTTNGKAHISFNYRWDETGSFEDFEDQVWIKGRFISPNSGTHYLGSHLDNDTDNPDISKEIDVENDPDSDITDGMFYQDISQWIESPGMYYLDIGGKLLRDYSNEEGVFSFDNIQIEINNNTDHHYFRKNFTINDLSKIKKGIINVLSDQRVIIYINGNKVFEDIESDEGSYWNTNGIKIDGKYFREGENVIAVELLNTQLASKFDLELIGLNESRNKAMLVMTDGQATQDSGCPQTGTPSQEAIQAACDAREEYGITVFAVGFSDSSDEVTLNSIAECGGGIFIKSKNATALDEFYKDVAREIMDISRVEQKIVVSGSPTLSNLYGKGSYIEIDYIPQVPAPSFGEIAVNFMEKLDYDCTFNFTVSDKIRVYDAKVTSYSSSKWTDFLYVNNKTVYNLSQFNPVYESLGDPFAIGFDPNLLNTGDNNQIIIRTGLDSSNSTGCSDNSTLIYTGLMKADVSYSNILAYAKGCTWNLEFEDGEFSTLKVPPDYAGLKICNYTSIDISYDVNDTYDDGMYNLMRNLDLDDDGKIDVNLVKNNLIVNTISMLKVPFPWGPTVSEVRIWK